MIIAKSTPWTHQSALAREVEIPKRNLVRLAKRDQSHKGWVILRRKAAQNERTVNMQRTVWKAIRLGRWSSGTPSGRLEIPSEWYAALAHIRSAHDTLASVNELEGNLGLLAQSEVSDVLQADRVAALKRLEKNVAVMTKGHDIFSDLIRVPQLLALFEPWEALLSPKYGDRADTASEEPVEKKLESVCIVGGHPQQYRIQKLKKQLDLTTADWPHFAPKCNSSHRGEIEQIRRGNYDVVVFITGFLNHNLYYIARDAAKEAGTPYACVPSDGLGSLKRAIREAIDTPYFGE